MFITHEPQTGWGFTHGAQTYTGYTTREEACEVLYDLERGRQTAGARTAAVRNSVAELPIAAQNEREAGARLEALLVDEDHIRHITGIDSSGPGQMHIECQICTDDRDTESDGTSWGMRYHCR